MENISSVILMRKILFKVIVLLLFIAGLGAGFYYWYPGFSSQNQAAAYKTAEEGDPYVRFSMETYDSILKNYWMPRSQLSEEQLVELFRLALEKVSGTSWTLPTKDRSGLSKMLALSYEKITEKGKKKQHAVDLATVVLYNLAPAGRNALHSEKQEIAFRQIVSNVNPDNDLYKNLGLQKGASAEEIAKAYQEKEAELKKATSTEAKAELEKIAYAQKVLADTNAKNLYDEAKIEPTLFSHVLGSTLYLYISQIAPTTLGEFGRAVDNASTTPGLESMVIDFRGNIGGSLDFLTHFLGIFIGQNQYAFDLFRQGEYLVQRTVLPKFPEVERFKEIAILTDNNTKSTAELTTSMFKHFNLARSVGATTAGWGTIENTYPLETVIDPTEKYMLLLVNSITLRSDGQPVEGRGVDPDVNIANANWREDLKKYFNDAGLIQALKEIAVKPPMR